MRIKFIFSNHSFATLIVILYLILSFQFYLVERNIKVIISISLVLISFFSALYTILKYKLSVQNKNKALLIIFFYLIIITIGYFNKTISIDNIYILAAPAFAFFVAKNEFNIKALYVVLIFIYLYLIKYVLTSGGGEEINAVFEMASRNVFSVIAITSTALVYLISIKQNRIIHVWPAAITFLISVLSVGRSGIITSLFLLLSLIFIYVKNSGMKLRVTLLFYFFIPCLFFVIYNFNQIVFFLNTLEQLEHLVKDGFESAERSEVVFSYLYNLDYLTVFTGLNYADIFIFQHLEMNPHNSYISLHHYVGFFSIIIFIYILKSLFHYLRSTMIVFCIFLTLLLRAWSDSVFFFSFYDFFFYLLIFQSNFFIKHNVKIHI